MALLGNATVAFLEEATLQSQEKRILAVFVPAYSWPHVYIVSIFLGILIFCVVGGNALVVLSVLTDKHLRVVSNYLILSLAVADLLVALFVMPLSAVHEVSKVWWLGLPLCDLWVCADVLLCTVSILHLCAIAIERCLAVSSITYLQHRSAILVLVMVIACWILSAMVSLPARFHAKRHLEISAVLYDGVCMINQEEGYTIYSNLLAFDLPMVFMVIMYARIYCTARRHIHKQHFAKYQLDTQKTDGNGQSLNSDNSGSKYRCCCCCCGFVLQTRFHKEGTIFPVSVQKCSSYQQSSSNGKRTTITEPPVTMVAAAAAALRMAVTMISTTKEPGQCSSASESLQYDNDDNPQPNQFPSCVSTISLSSEVGGQPSDQAEHSPANPITYDTLREVQRAKRENSPKVVPQISTIGGDLKRDISVHTNVSSLLFADETPGNAEGSPGMYSRKIPQTDSQNPQEVRCTMEEVNGGANFTSLNTYYRKQRERKWLAKRKDIGLRAQTLMNELVINGSVSSMRPEEDKSIRTRVAQKRESRAIRTLAIITGCFVLCWLPFNIHALLSPFFGQIHPIGVSFLLWLGYINSLLNPVIYTIFSKEFRNGFRRIICGGHRSRSSRR